MRLSKQISREFLVFVLASLILMGIAWIFSRKESREDQQTIAANIKEVIQIWDELDSSYISSYNMMLGTGKDKNFDLVVGKFHEALEADPVIAKEILRLKLLSWINMVDPEKIVSKPNSLASDQIDTDIMSRLSSPKLQDLYNQSKPRELSWGSITKYIQSYEDLFNAVSKNNEIDSDLIRVRDELLGLLQGPSGETPAAAVQPWELLFFIGLTVFFLCTLITLLSRFIARLIAASYLQDVIAGGGTFTWFKLKLLPYFFGVPAFVLASLFFGRLPGSDAASLLVVLLVVLVSGGLSFELVLKYLEQVRQEYARPYARYLALYKRDNKKLGWGRLIGQIFMPKRCEHLRRGTSILPFVLTGADYQLTQHIRRRMAVIVDSYTVAGVILSFSMWGSKPDLVGMLTGTIGSYGVSGEIFWMIEAILLGLLLSKLLFIISESRQFPSR